MRSALRLRAWLGILAAMGVLLHAGVLVRHSLAMAAAARQYRVLLADLMHLCRTGSGETFNGASDLPHPPPPDHASGCPVCAGLVSAFMLTGPQPLTLPAQAAAPTRPCRADVAQARLLRLAHPPARGPTGERLMADDPRGCARAAPPYPWLPRATL
jgi:hypothetical protein